MTDPGFFLQDQERRAREPQRVAERAARVRRERYGAMLFAAVALTIMWAMLRGLRW
ncbi:hypothetical protein [Methylobacterium trifolii]|uniref:Uncharacterized protein n=1 Tax=Methylobacterium trifolii TaxID=1003092 RepID=A0ABQ4U4F0_9HYPH|nr:hypothetical protein [Methylobacterium trifolii]GJE61774.1 hypothetical protein MPOCJGCO_3900 [Methylobacterium trifolii]